MLRLTRARICWYSSVESGVITYHLQMSVESPILNYPTQKHILRILVWKRGTWEKHWQADNETSATIWVYTGSCMVEKLGRVTRVSDCHDAWCQATNLEARCERGFLSS